MIVGIDVGSTTHYARAFDWRNYEYSKKTIVNNSSGKHNGESHISYRGRKRLRYILYEAAISLVGKNNVNNPLF